jgi:flagellar biosynthesis/type III secretory pathway protein FliH
MSDMFVPLDAFLRPGTDETAPEPSPPPEELTIPPHAEEQIETLRRARRFRAALSDALDAAVQDLLPAIAREVLARELVLGEADVASIVAVALARFSRERVLSIRAHPRDLDALGSIELDRIADDTLQPGDIRLDLRSGTIDLTLADRLDAVLAACPL